MTRDKFNKALRKPDPEKNLFFNGFKLGYGKALEIAISFLRQMKENPMTDLEIKNILPALETDLIIFEKHFFEKYRSKILKEEDAIRF